MNRKAMGAGTMDEPASRREAVSVCTAAVTEAWLDSPLRRRTWFFRAARTARVKWAAHTAAMGIGPLQIRAGLHYERIYAAAAGVARLVTRVSFVFDRHRQAAR
jgi:hypothetical protein